MFQVIRFPGVEMRIAQVSFEKTQPKLNSLYNYQYIDI